MSVFSCKSNSRHNTVHLSVSNGIESSIDFNHHSSLKLQLTPFATFKSFCLVSSSFELKDDPPYCIHTHGEIAENILFVKFPGHREATVVYICIYAVYPCIDSYQTISIIQTSFWNTLYVFMQCIRVLIAIKLSA